MSHERRLAAAAGLGWTGKNTLLLNARRGSRTFLGVIVSELDLEPTPSAGLEADLRAAADPEAALLERVDERTRLLAVSSVQWTDGLRLDRPRLGRALRSSGTSDTTTTIVSV